jgi:hypothetical protein
MEYGICDLALIPLRAEPNDRSELVSQILFGECFTINEKKDKWVHVQTVTDQYNGWIDYQQFVQLDEFVFNQLHSMQLPVTSRPFTMAWKQSNKSVLLLPAGSCLPYMRERICHIKKEAFELVGEINEENNLIEQAKSYLEVPYLWGGRTHFGIDCSGFTQSVFRCAAGINLCRDAWQQAGQGEVVHFLQEAQPGDLAFFDNDEGKITHVGILLNNHEIIHASGRVKIDSIDDQGIYSAGLKKYTHTLRIIKRISII